MFILRTLPIVSPGPASTSLSRTLIARRTSSICLISTFVSAKAVYSRRRGRCDRNSWRASCTLVGSLRQLGLTRGFATSPRRLLPTLPVLFFRRGTACRSAATPRTFNPYDGCRARASGAFFAVGVRLRSRAGRRRGGGPQRHCRHPGGG